MRTLLIILICSALLWSQENTIQPLEDSNPILYSYDNHAYMSRDEWKSITRRRRGLKTGGGLLIGSGSILAPLGGLWILFGIGLEENAISVLGLTAMSAGTGMIVGGVKMVREGKALEKEYPFLSRVDISPYMDIKNGVYGTAVTINF